MDIYDKLLAINSLLHDLAIPFAFGGAIALSFHGEPRATTDIDINIFWEADAVDRVFDAMETLFAISDRELHRRQIVSSAQTRLTWEETYIDLFFTDFVFHQSMATRVRTVPFRGEQIPVISAEDLILCKILTR